MSEQNILDKCVLYRLLLHPVNETGKGDAYIKETLQLVTKIVDARLGYIEVSDSDGNKLWSTHHCNETDCNRIKSHISSTIIKEALTSGETVVTTSALLDDRFNNARSVILGNIESVLCSPIEAEGIKGVIYLQGNFSGLCDRHNVDEAELFKRHILPLLKRLKYSLSNHSPEEDLYLMYKLNGVIGKTPTFLQVLNEAMTVASLDVSILLNGETGTGKSYLSKFIHLNSFRSNHPFIHLNCTNIPESLFEGELFGSVKGAYSGAHSNFEGKIFAASGGTLFLDEISEMPITAQAKLLQFLEEGYYFPLGSSKKVYPNIRIIFASNANFKKRIEEGTFREDLYYRIASFPINVPALRERKEDIPAIADSMVKKLCNQFNFNNFLLSEKAIEKLKYYSWPGNIRELQNKLQQGLIRAKMDGVTQIREDHLFSEAKNSVECIENSNDLSFSNEKNKWEKQFISKQLDLHSWNITKTAASLKMSRSYLNKLVKDFKLKKT